ncbi:REPEAT-CONTAINING PROTEIN putative-RELATED [Salix koriyanagi]|uniref:REPEAT-CONTAINING PROTEIN putative-RELATED n=1 Tax=Salix koriyanagi TaxID=2511006 RepID=A0A9Q0SZK1_9ROSI|nr:REPEAT-CONTAINING PROTEIN putative-RELATED [Salix koriyanagi]
MDVLSSTRMPSFLKPEISICTSQCKRSLGRSSHVRGSTICHGELALTHKVLDEIPLPDTFAWNSLIHTHLSNRDPGGALSIYHHMMMRGARPDCRTLPRVLTASRICGDLFLGKQLHGQAIKLGFFDEHYVITALIEIYGRLDGIEAGKWLFDKSPRRNSVAWTMILKLYLLENKPELAINVFYQMVELNALIDSVVLITAAGACGLLKSVEHGRRVHHVARKFQLESDILVSNSLLKMHIDCERMEDAREFFNQMTTKDVISWTEIICGYVKKGEFNEALKLFRKMNMDGIKPDPLSISSVLPACARTVAHKNGKEIHGYSLRNGIDNDLVVQNATMDMYAKSGLVDYALKVFERMKKRDVISWTVMILGFSLHGKGEIGVEFFCRMEKDQRVEADQFTYAAVLHCCTTACKVEEGKFYFNCIKKPNITHYALMRVLGALLDGCWMHHRRNIGKQVFEQLFDLEPRDAENYVLLSKWYSDNEKWDLADKLRETIMGTGSKPKKAYSWIEFQNKVHVFGTGDISHPRSEGIYTELQCLMKKVKC